MPHPEKQQAVPLQSLRDVPTAHEKKVVPIYIIQKLLDGHTSLNEH